MYEYCDLESTISLMIYHQVQIIFELALDINQAKDQADELTLYVG